MGYQTYDKEQFSQLVTALNRIGDGLRDVADAIRDVDGEDDGDPALPEQVSNPR